MAILTIHWSFNVAFVLLSALAAVYFYMTRNFSYWVERGINAIPPIPFFGNFLDCCLFRVSTSRHLESFYKHGKGLPYVGFHVFDKPALLLRDPKIIKHVLVKDFNCFSNRYVSTHESDSIGAASMLLLKNPPWKDLRNKTSPIFTSVKMKNMFRLMLDVEKNLVTHLDALKLQDGGGVVQVKDVSAMYTMDVITSCAFGLQIDTLNDPESAFRKCGTSIFGFTTYKRGAEFAAFFFTPSLVKLLRLKFFSKEASDFMREIFAKVMAVRMESNIYRNDLIDLLIQLKNSHNQTDEPDAFKLEGDNLVAQAATFFAAGFETTSSTMAFSLYELALQPDIQSKLREELTAALADNDGEITYEMVMNLPYLDMVVSETLRKYPSLPILDRVAGCDYEVPRTGLVIEKGTPVYISLLGLHYDPEYFPDPEKYEPQRFSKENKHKIPPCVYMPFGDGPRNCIGLRFGLLVAKLGLFEFILNYEVSPSEETPIPMRFDPKALPIVPEGGLFLKVRRTS